jgi:uncharacterized RDD family membrane protein YckC
MRPDNAGVWPVSGQVSLVKARLQTFPFRRQLIMRCPACGAFYHERSARCPECGAIQNESSTESSEAVQTEKPIIVAETPLAKGSQTEAAPPAGNRSLIEFPGVHRSALPEWRKELGERVREVQERRAREAVMASGAEPLFSELESRSTPPLELLPQAEAQTVNPLVAAALRRIERAYSEPMGHAAIATALVYDEQPEPTLEPAVAEELPLEAKPERVHNLAVVPTPPPVIEPAPLPVAVPSRPETKPRRVIDEQNDPALNYLDSIPTSITVDYSKYRSAPVYLRLCGALADLLVVSLCSAPILALTRLTTMEWANPRVIGFAAGTFLVMGFLYLTVSIAFTGRTLGMKLCGLRAVDTRTGLIPTGSQSAGRALLYLLSLASAGILLIYALVDSDRHAAHDRFTRTAVVRA